MKTISLEFDGYWREVNKGSVPAKSGIYCVYACTYNKNESTVSIRELIYVGESVNVNERISQHERLSDWKKRLNVNEMLCYSFGGISGDDRYRAEAAIICHHKPPCNNEYKTSFPFEDTRLNISGKHSKIDSDFIVRDTR